LRFAHIADCHVGSWRDPKLREVSIAAFEKAIDLCIEKKVDFVLISGDLFHTALPGIDSLKMAVKKLKELQNNDIPVYISAGSHDFSPSGKTILDVLSEAKLVINVVKGSVDEETKKLKLRFTVDEKTGAQITGMIGKKGMLEKTYYENLEKANLEKEKGFKIFMFHTALTELKPEELEQMDSSPVSLLPKDFDYYAGGHVHIVEKASLEGYKNIVYPGPLFPTNFAELEKLEGGGFYLYEDGEIEFIPINIKNVFSIKQVAEHKTPEEVQEELLEKIKKHEFNNTIVLLRVFGTLKHGKSSDVDFKQIMKACYDRGAFFVMKNTAKLTSEEFEEIKISQDSADAIEENVIKEHLGQIKVSFEEEKTAKALMDLLSSEKQEGEKVYEYNARIKKEIDEMLGIGL
jgi:DNA repair exonuclease SbcCD nuclease subunit